MSLRKLVYSYMILIIYTKLYGLKFLFLSKNNRFLHTAE